MPTYEFRCQKCRKKAEYVVSAFEDEPEGCDFCGSPELEKLVSSPSRFRKKIKDDFDIVEEDFGKNDEDDDFVDEETEDFPEDFDPSELDGEFEEELDDELEEDNLKNETEKS